MIPRALELLRVDFRPAHRHPLPGRIAVAAVVAIVVSLVADAVLAHIGVAVWPALRGYVHFRFSDYAKLTVIGIVIAAIGWPICSRVTSSPRWLYAVSAWAVTLVLFLPDLYIWYAGSPARAVLILMCMHVVIGLVTYEAMVRLAPVGRSRYAALTALRVPVHSRR